MEVSEKQCISILCEKNVHTSSSRSDYTIYLKTTSFSTASAVSGISFFILVDTQNIPFDLARTQLFITMAASCLRVLLFTCYFFKATMDLYTYVPNSVFSTGVFSNITT